MRARAAKVVFAAFFSLSPFYYIYIHNVSVKAREEEKNIITLEVKMHCLLMLLSERKTTSFNSILL